MIYLTLFISALLSYFFLILTRDYFIKNNIIDKINKRSSHNITAVRSGGLGIFIPIILISIYFYVVGVEIFDFSFLIPLLILLLIGVYDDTSDADYKLKFIFQIIAAKIIIDNGLVIDNLHGVFGIESIGRVAAQSLTIFIILAIINSINFIDGIDGLATSIILFLIVSFEIFSIGKSDLLILSIIVVGSLLPLLFLNYQKNKKIFLGDSGSLFLGGLASIYILKIVSNDYLILDRFDINKILFVFSVFCYPVIDITRIVLIRLINKKSPFEADKNHIHHHINKRFKQHYKVVLIILLFSLINFTLIHLFF